MSVGDDELAAAVARLTEPPPPSAPPDLALTAGLPMPTVPPPPIRLPPAATPTDATPDLGLAAGPPVPAAPPFRLPPAATPTDATPDLGLAAGPPVPAKAPPSLDEIAAATQRMDLLHGTDTATGAPVEVRAAVGAAPKPDRLATLRSYYSDATPLPGTDNFVYTNAQGKRQTYAPTGWRIPTAGDIASIGPELSEGAGGTAGGILGGVAGGPATAALGSGVGAMAARSGYDWVLRQLGLGPIDTRTPAQRDQDAAVTAAVNTVLPVIGERIGGPAIASLLRSDAGPTATATAADALRASGVAPTLALPAGVAGESPVVEKVEQVLSSLPFTSVTDRYGNARTALAGGVNTVAQRVAAGQAVPTADTFSSTVNDIAQRVTDRFSAAREAADDTATNLIGADTPVDLQPLRDLRDSLQAKLAQAPLSLQARYGQAIERVNGMLADATKTGSDTLPFNAVRNIRTDIGKEIDWTASGADTPTGLPALKDVYGALKESLLGTAHDAGPEAEAALAEHDAMVNRFNDGPAQTFADLANPDRRANTVTKMMQSTAPSDQESLMHLMTYSTPAERQQIAAGVIQQMGTRPDGEFDMGLWARNYAQANPSARAAMFGQAGGDLDNLATVQQQMAKAGGYRNFSGTAPAVAIVAALSTLGKAAAATAGGDIHTAAIAGAGLASPWIAGRLLTSQPFVRWMSGASLVNPATIGAWGQYLGRLGAVAQADPSIAGLVSQLRQALPEQLPQQKQQGGTP